jgi:hypothetical protein
LQCILYGGVGGAVHIVRYPIWWVDTVFGGWARITHKASKAMNVLKGELWCSIVPCSISAMTLTGPLSRCSNVCFSSATSSGAAGLRSRCTGLSRSWLEAVMSRLVGRRKGFGTSRVTGQSRCVVVWQRTLHPGACVGIDISPTRPSARHTRWACGVLDGSEGSYRWGTKRCAAGRVGTRASRQSSAD